ncbi:MAG: hypothetical protein LR015_00655 [Verrucomicrobia bacterium]|nr:hypothetical protein [Verrucomicrobiota bacterium]
MQLAEVEICQESGKRDRIGRRVLGPEKWLELLERYDESGLTQLEFSRRECISYGTLVAWLGRRKSGKLKVGLESSMLSREQVAAVKPASMEQMLEVSFPDGVVMRGSDALQLTKLLRGTGRV